MYSDESSDEYGGDGYGGFAAAPPFQRYTGRQRQFKRFYSAYPMAAYGGNKIEANYGGKILMPPSALDELSQLEVVYPLLFKLQNEDAAGDDGSAATRRTHCGVLEFVAEEGRVYLPQWMMETLHLDPGAAVEVINVALLHGSLVKLQPQSTDFLDISDHRAVLENALRRFSALTVDDKIAIEYNGREYKIAILETQPSPSAINIVETDLSVDFAPPVGYVEPTPRGESGSQTSASGQQSADGSRPHSSIAKDILRKESAAKDEAASLRFQAFRGAGARLGSAAADRPAASSVRSYAAAGTGDQPHGAGDTAVAAGGGQEAPVPLDMPVGTLYFGYQLVPPPGSEPGEDEGQPPKDRFQGEGRALRQRRKR
ncbi:ubiquitin fusion degradation protein [Coemansia helicoidea]|uniref:Ubiquitin fusion degradation protein n=1 Tax=Coemansia helicoidea TaxID=1286919 RepID=A0ACC1LC29_9FUNG|nr:ubiquitin fusion degradation protein [Coemansia helicoidea]